MKNPKLHHYVSQFYLKLFCDESKRLWVWDKSSRKVYRTTPRSVASQTYFYRVPEFIGTDVDPLCLEKDLSSLEDDAANLLAQLIPLLRDIQHCGAAGDPRFALRRYRIIRERNIR